LTDKSRLQEFRRDGIINRGGKFLILSGERLRLRISDCGFRNLGHAARFCNFCDPKSKIPNPKSNHAYFVRVSAFRNPQCRNAHEGSVLRFRNPKSEFRNPVVSALKWRDERKIQL
jgi:hypothetical protein